MLCYAMLCYAMLCYAMLCYAMLCYAMLYYAILCYTMLCYMVIWALNFIATDMIIFKAYMCHDKKVSGRPGYTNTCIFISNFG